MEKDGKHFPFLVIFGGFHAMLTAWKASGKLHGKASREDFSVFGDRPTGKSNGLSRLEIHAKLSTKEL
jgi:hypothetical protein